MRLPVSISAVAMMVSEPPSSTLRAAAKKAAALATRWRQFRPRELCRRAAWTALLGARPGV